MSKFPDFNTDLYETFWAYNYEIYFTHNKLSTIEVISQWIDNLKILHLDFNQISLINVDAFLNMKFLEVLSLSNNKLCQINSTHFNYLYNLKYFNISFNEIDFIEANSFEKMGKLLVLDLSFNSLVSIDDEYLFHGLENLNNLYLFNEFDFTLNTKSFEFLANISKINVNESLVLLNE